MSKYVNRMKDVIVSFNATAGEIRKKMDFCSENYNADYAAEERNKLQIQLKQAEENARNEIDAIRFEAGKAVRKWAFLDGEKIDAADIKLLDGSFNLSAENIHELLVKHQDSCVMVNAIAKYAKEHNIATGYIPNLADKLLAYISFATSAHNVISDIAGNIGLPANDISISHWGKPGNISQRMETILYGIKAQEPAPAAPKATFNFDFKPLAGR